MDEALDRTLTQGAAPPAGASGELADGARLGHFQINRKLGAGGMGEVYLATDLALDRPVAVKVLPAGVASGGARDRMVKEARAQARVHHPHVAHIYFIGEEQGRLYFAMEYLSGKTLADQLAQGPLPVEDALAMIRAAVLGLREAQRSGFTHRDVKPSNLMVDGHGVLKVLDFGLAHGTAGVATDGPVAQTSFAGTPLYMAPEQARGEPVDFRADIYALGATLFHLVSGRPPFMADSVNELITMHATAARPAIPRTRKQPRTTITAIDALIARMMAPNPADRFASYDELLRALELASAQQTRPAGFLVRTIATGADIGLVVAAIGVVRVIAFGGGDIDMGLYGLALAMVYAILALRRWGTTAGKALFELEVVSVATHARPSWRQAIIREVIVASPPIAISWLAFGFKRAHIDVPNDLFGILGAASAIVMCLMLLHAALRVPGKRAPWDRVAGTVVRYRTTRGSATLGA